MHPQLSLTSIAFSWSYWQKMTPSSPLCLHTHPSHLLLLQLPFASSSPSDKVWMAKQKLQYMQRKPEVINCREVQHWTVTCCSARRVDSAHTLL